MARFYLTVLIILHAIITGIAQVARVSTESWATKAIQGNVLEHPETI